MPIQIKELNIKINVDADRKEVQNVAVSKKSAQTTSINVDEIIRILRKKEER
jgi:hypothetical protein